MGPKEMSATIDERILALLAQNSRASFSEIGGKLGLSRTAVKKRIERLCDKGQIRRFTIEIGSTKTQAEPLAVEALFHLTLRGSYCRKLYTAWKNWPEIRGFWSLAGDLDMMLLIRCATMESLESLRERMSRHADIRQVATTIVLREWINKP